MLYSYKKNLTKGTIFIEKILPMFSWIIFIATLLLQIGVKKSMTINRDLIYRNKILNSSILKSSHLSVYQGILFIGIAFCIFLYFINMKRFSYHKLFAKKNDGINRLKKYLILTFSMSILCISMLVFYQEVTLLAYPFMMMGALLVVMIQYARLIYNCKI